MSPGVPKTGDRRRYRPGEQLISYITLLRQLNMCPDCRLWKRFQCKASYNTLMAVLSAILISCGHVLTKLFKPPWSSFGVSKIQTNIGEFHLESKE